MRRNLIIYVHCSVVLFGTVAARTEHGARLIQRHMALCDNALRLILPKFMQPIL